MNRWPALVLLGVLAAGAHAEPVADEPDDEHVGMAIFEAAVALAIPAAWYWSTKEHQAVDFELDNDWPSWRIKLFSTDKLLLDTNPFYVNAIRHPLAGVIDFQILRSNGFTPATSTMFAAIKGAVWEYFFEFREDPSINDLFFNTAGAMAIGEPMYRIGQLWRGGRVTLADRARTALTSPFDAFHDTYRAPHRFVRPSAWATIELAAAGLVRTIDGVDHGEVAGVADIDVVSNARFVDAGRSEGQIHFGEWSRLRAGVNLGEKQQRTTLTRTLFRTETSLFGRYRQDGELGELVALGTAFTYRRDWLGLDSDRLAIAHLMGPRVQLSRHGSRTMVLWDTAAYADFALAEALVFGPVSPFPRPPPYYSSLQSEGYIGAYGLTGTMRLRANVDAVHAELETDFHFLHQIHHHDRVSDASDTSARALAPGVTTVSGIEELCVYWRAELGFQPGTWGASVMIDGAQRTSTWQDLRRTSTELSFGAALTLLY
jgi:hypothetical protein